MSIKKIKTESLIRDYLLDEGILKEKLTNSNFDFGFVISFPPGPKSELLSVYKPKNKNKIDITIRIKLSEKHAKTLTSLKNNRIFQFYNDIRRYFIIKEVYFKIDFKNFMYEIHEQIFLDNNESISKNDLFKGIKKVFYCFLFSNLLLEEYCSEKELSSKKFTPGFDFSFYS
ncbi:MAG: DUF2299 family protein [Promethearchaeota archaeon]